MAGNDFLLIEVIPLGGKAGPSGKAEGFLWTARNRNIPQGSWEMPVTLRTIRTDYPGGDDPTEQVLGPNYEPFTLAGRWDDRYNAAPLDSNNPGDRAILDGRDGRAARAKQGGYALREWRRFEAFVRRGNQMRITFEGITILGIITNFVPEYRRSWDIGYSFTVSPHHRQPGGFFALKRSPRTVLNAKQLRDEVSVAVDEGLAFHANAPQIRIVDTLYTQVNNFVAQWVSGLVVIDDAISQRTLSVETERNIGLLRLASTFFSMATTAVNIIDLLEAEDSSEAMDFEQGIQTLAYDVWARGIQNAARSVIVAGMRASAEMQQRAEPRAQRLYTPFAGESLYSVSNRFYRTPHNWRIIYTRNGLTDTVLTGNEILIIPDVTGR